MHSCTATPEQLATLSSLDTRSLDYLPYRHDAVISLTTVPTRLHTLKAVIHCLMMQTVPGVPIEVHIAQSVLSLKLKWDAIPAWITELQCLKLVKHPYDVGPAMKYLPAMVGDLRRCIIAVDDDVLYPKDLVEMLLKADGRWKGAAAICYRGWKINRELSWERSFLSKPEINEDVHVGILTGHGGYCVRPEHLCLVGLTNINEAPRDCWMMDDIWISGHLSRRRTPKRLIEGSTRYKIPIEPALGGNRAERNNKALRWFSDAWTQDDYEDI
jgi:hypothetical protein